MTYKEIESYFKNEKKLEELLEIYSSKFELVEKDADCLINNDIFTQEEIENILSRETGIYMQLNIVTEIAETFKKKEEGRLNFQKVKECEKAGNKIVQTQIDKEISHDVQYLRRIRNLLNAYRNSSDKCIGSCQSRLKRAKNGNYYSELEKEKENDEETIY